MVHTEDFNKYKTGDTQGTLPYSRWFPATIVLDSDTAESATGGGFFGFDNTNVNGPEDLIVLEQDDSLFPYYIENPDSLNNEFENTVLWLKGDTWGPNVNDFLTVAYGDNDQNTDNQSESNTFSDLYDYELYAMYTLNDLQDRSGRQNNLTADGVFQVQTLDYGSAAAFDGTATDYLTVSNFDPYNDPDSFDNAVVATASFYPNAGPSGQVEYAKVFSIGEEGTSGRYWVELSDAGEITAGIREKSSGAYQTVNSGVVIDSFTWHTATLRVVNGNIELYVDGSLEASDAGGYPMPPSDMLSIGNDVKGPAATPIDADIANISVATNTVDDYVIEAMHEQTPATTDSDSFVYQNAAVRNPVAYVRGVADELGVNDTALDAANYVRSVSDQTGLTDAASTAANYVEVVSDTLGVADTVTKVKDFVRNVADTTGLTDAASRTVGFSRTTTDSTGLNDAVSRTAGFARTVSDAAGLNGAVVTVKDLVRSVSDSAGLTGTVNSAVNYAEIVSEQLGVRGSVSTVKDLARTVSDTAGLAGNVAVNKITAILVNVSDGIGLSGQVSRTAEFKRQVTDTVGVSTQAVKGLAIKLTDSAGLQSSVKKSAMYAAKLGETLGIQSVARTRADYKRLVTGEITLTDVATSWANSLLNRVGLRSGDDTDRAVRETDETDNSVTEVDDTDARAVEDDSNL